MRYNTTNLLSSLVRFVYNDTSLTARMSYGDRSKHMSWRPLRLSARTSRRLCEQEQTNGRGVPCTSRVALGLTTRMGDGDRSKHMSWRPLRLSARTGRRPCEQKQTNGRGVPYTSRVALVNNIYTTATGATACCWCSFRCGLVIVLVHPMLCYINTSY